MPFYNPIKEKEYKVDMDTVVPVIASFDTEGNIIPLYVRLNRKAYKLKIIFCQPIEPKQHGYSIYKYHCSFSDHNFYREIHLTYYRFYNFWTWKESD